MALPLLAPSTLLAFLTRDVTTVAQRNNLRNHQRDKVEKLMSKTRSQRMRRRAQDVVEVTKRLRRLREKNHMTRVMRSQESVTACVWPIPVEDASVLADVLAQNVAERRIDMSQDTVLPILNIIKMQLESRCFSKKVQKFFKHILAHIIKNFIFFLR